MKLLYCIPGLYNSGGMERVLTEKVNRLISKDYDITILTTDQKGRKPYFTLNPKVRCIDLGLNFDEDYKLPYWRKAIIYRKKLNVFRDAIEKELNAGVYDYAISLCGKEISFWSKMNTTSKKIAELHFAQNFKSQFISSRQTSKILTFVGKLLTKQFISNTLKLDQLVVLTKADEKRWLKTNRNVIQIYNPSSITTTVSPNLNAKRLIAVGRLDEQKGFDNLIHIWATVNKTHPDWSLDIYGSGPQFSFLNDLITKYNLRDKVRLMGATDDIQGAYLNSSGMVMTSRYEGFPLALIEAQSCGLPIVAFDCQNGPAEIVRDNINGFLVPLYDNNLMIDRICRIISDIGLRKKFSVAAKEDSLRFSPENIIKSWDGLFKNFKNINHSNDYSR